jgi:Icc-related predicted phosphoesterase
MNVRIFFAADVHGSDVCFRKFLNAVKIYKVDVAILGGDLTGKLVIPVVRIGEKHYEADFANRRWTVKEGEELNKLLGLIRNSGFYPKIMDEGEYDRIKSDNSLIKKIFDEASVEIMKEWVKMAEEKLKNMGVQCYIMPGNDDSKIIDEVLEGSELIVNPDEKVLEIKGGFEMLSLGASNPTPWKTPREYTEEELERKLMSLLNHVKDPESAIFNIHVPPYKTLLDMAPLLDDELRVVTKGGRIVFVHVGSESVRRIIEKNQPLIGLHGHIHESKGVEKLGRTLCFNPGSEYGEGFLRGILINLEKGKVKNHLFTYG